MHRSLFLTLGVLALVLAPSLGNQFIYDDLFVFVTTDLVHSLSNVPNFFAHNTMWAAGHLEPLLVDTYRPLTLTTFALDSVVTGRNPLGYHLTNLLLHALNTAMVYAVARRLFSDTNKRHAWIPAAAFSYSPWLGEAHLWINGRSDPLCLALLAGALLAWDRACQDRAARWHFAAGFLFLGALLSKEVALMALPILPLWPPLQKQYKNLRARCVLCAAPLAAAGLYLALRGWVLQGLKTHGDLSQLLDALSYLGVLYWDGLTAVLIPSTPHPRSLSESYDAVSYSLRWLALALALLGLTLVWWQRKREPVAAFGVLFFAATLAPAALIPTMVWPGFGRYLYIPFAMLSIGIISAGLQIGTQIARFKELYRTRIARIVLMAYLGLNAFLLHASAYSFRDDGAYYTAAIEATPGQAFGYAFLGMSLLTHRHPEEALPYLRRAIDLQPYEPKYRYALGYALIQTGALQAAEQAARSWLETGRVQDRPRYLELLATALEPVDPEGARDARKACLLADPRWLRCREALAPQRAN